MRLKALAALALLATPGLVSARNIVIANDDGLTSNVKALYEALKAQGHDVIVSVPCANQSGMGAAIRFMQPLRPLAADCRNGAAKAGSPGAGPMTRAGFERDFFYVDGTPVMALLYGLDVAAQGRWGRAPDLVLSGPNEGQNVGPMTLTSGTVSNAQYGAARGIPSIAFSAGLDTDGGMALANPKSLEVARLSAGFIAALDRRVAGRAILPAGVALNVNFPDKLEGAQWKMARVGNFTGYALGFTTDIGGSKQPGVTVQPNRAPPSPAQRNDEAAVNRAAISVSVMQAGYDAPAADAKRIARSLRGLVSP
jgi:5'-nucleotidase